MKIQALSFYKQFHNLKVVGPSPQYTEREAGRGKGRRGGGKGGGGREEVIQSSYRSSL